MAETAGLVLGVVALAGTFKDCVDLFTYFSAYRSLDRDYEILVAKLDVEKTLLLQWAVRVRLLRPDHDLQLDDSTTQNAVAQVLASIRQLLGESSSLQERYGLKQYREQPTAGSAQGMATTLSRGHMERFTEEFHALQIRMQQMRTAVPISAKCRWVITDKDKFEKLVQDLSHFVSKLGELVPGVHQAPEHIATRAMLWEDLSRVGDFRILGLIRDATLGRPDHVAGPAEARFEEALQSKILDRIQFRSMDDRRKDVAPAHHKTLTWAMNPPVDVGGHHIEWDDLSLWLRSGSEIYWISGKAGSGKSTLMNYLYNHDDARNLLSHWAGTSPLTMGSFFFWNLGTAEQKSHAGLSRAILYQLLKENRALIPALLPRIWEQAYAYRGQQEDLFGLEAPSLVELASAFQRLRSSVLRQHFCFFIDGLDEYSGNYLDAIAFVKNLCLNSRIKILVSSRPIPLCTDAFSSLPKLQLQDLTLTDIETYVRETIGSHKYMEHLLLQDRPSSETVLRQLVDKASGVFLWVILACRSLLAGFVAFDTISELASYVDELPPELEGMFRHMLEKVEGRYFEQAAKMLRICYRRQAINQSSGSHEAIYAITWAVLDHAAMDFEKVSFQLSQRPNGQFLRQHVEGRLRSRCGGLLETRPSHAALSNVTVEFMHRSVFEFLDSPGIWDASYLRIHDKRFNANAALSFLSIQMLHLRWNFGRHRFMTDAFQCAHLSDGENPELGLALLRWVEQVMTDNERHGLLHEWLIPSEFIELYGRDNFRLVMAIEADMVNYVRDCLPRQELNSPLLYLDERGAHLNWKVNKILKSHFGHSRASTRQERERGNQPSDLTNRGKGPATRMTAPERAVETLHTADSRNSASPTNQIITRKRRDQDDAGSINSYHGVKKAKGS